MYTRLSVDGRVSSPTTEAGLAAGGTHAPKSPALSLKTATAGAAGAGAGSIAQAQKDPSFASLSQAMSASQVDTSSPHMGPNSGSLAGSQVFSASPLTTSDSMRDLHLSASEPRYFPGVISRRQRTGSMRQGSMHESDENASRSGKRGGGGDKGAKEESAE